MKNHPPGNPFFIISNSQERPGWSLKSSIQPWPSQMGAAGKLLAYYMTGMVKTGTLNYLHKHTHFHHGDTKISLACLPGLLKEAHTHRRSLHTIKYHSRASCYLSGRGYLCSKTPTPHLLCQDHSPDREAACKQLALIRECRRIGRV